MSWNIAASGKGAEVVESLRRQAAKLSTNTVPAQNSAVSATDQIAQAFATQFPEKQIVVESFGHVDAFTGNLDVKVRVYQP